MKLASIAITWGGVNVKGEMRYICCANRHQKKAGVAMLISD